MRGTGRWLTLAALLIALVVGVLLLAGHEGLDWASKLSEVASFILALAVVLIPVILRAFRWPSLKLITDEEIEADAADLVAGLRGELGHEQPLLGRERDAIIPMRLQWEMPTERGNLRGWFGDILLAFSLAPSRRLVILGESGGGKSTLALDLARRLVESRKPGDQVPVVLHVARWNPSEKLADWIARQLARDHPGLARRGRSESGNMVTHAQALVAMGKVIPILDGLDEMAASLRADGIAEINRYGTDKPLVVASRTNAYRNAVHGNRGRPLARAAELTLCDLRPAEIRDFLTPVPDEHWNRLFGRLDAEPGGALALALGNPLMLSLCQAIYANRSPDELADRYRFAQHPAIEDHLLGRFVHAAYASPSGPADAGTFRCTGEQAQRWLSFLAGYSDQFYLPWRYRTTGEIPAPDLSWWHLYRAERGGWRILGPVVRGILRVTVIAAVAIWVLARHGYWRDGWYRGPVHVSSLLLDGPLGRLARPVADQLLPARSADVIIAGLAVGFVFMTELAHIAPLVPLRVSIRPFKTLRTVLAAAVILPLLAAGVMTWRFTQERHHLPVATFIDSRSTLVTLLAVALGGLLWLPWTLIAPTDRRGTVSPPESLRLDRQADIVVTMLWRSTVAAILLMWSGAQIAVAYAIFAAAATLLALLLGGRLSFASRSYTDACWALGLSRRLPRQVMAFMADAESRGVLRATGTDYEFRHIRVQQQLHDSWGRSRWLGQDVRREKRRDLRQRLTRPHESLSGLTRIVEEYRTLAGRSDSAAFGEFGPKLADALGKLAAKLGQLGRREDEVDVVSERTEVYRNLAERDPGKFRPKLAGSLAEMAERLAKVEKFSESLGVTHEEVGIWRELAQADTKYHLNLAGSLSRLARNLRPLAGHADNLGAIGHTVECLRELEPDDARVCPSLAEALVHQAFTLRASGQPHEYQRVMTKAINLCRKLSYLRGVEDPYWLLGDLAKPLWKAGQYHDALMVIEIVRGFGGEHYFPTEYEKLIHSLQRNSRAFRWRRVLAEHGWSLAIGSPDWQKRYAHILGIMAGYLDELAFYRAVQGRQAEAEARAAESAATYCQAVDIFQELSEAQPATFFPDLARSLDTLAAELRKTGDPGDWEDAEAATTRATLLRRGLGLPSDHSEPRMP